MDTCNLHLQVLEVNSPHESLSFVVVIWRCVVVFGFGGWLGGVAGKGNLRPNDGWLLYKDHNGILIPQRNLWKKLGFLKLFRIILHRLWIFKEMQGRWLRLVSENFGTVQVGSLDMDIYAKMFFVVFLGKVVDQVLCQDFSIPKYESVMCFGKCKLIGLLVGWS